MLRKKDCCGCGDWKSQIRELWEKYQSVVKGIKAGSDTVYPDGDGIADIDDAIENEVARQISEESLVTQSDLSEAIADFATVNQLDTGLATVTAAKQDKLVNQLNIKSVNGQSLLGSGDMQVSADSVAWDNVTDKPEFAEVATSGSYNDLTNKPTIPAAQVNADWNAESGVAQILNKPSLATVATSGSYDDLTNKPSIPSAVILYSGTGQNTDGAMTQKATTDALNDRLKRTPYQWTNSINQAPSNNGKAFRILSVRCYDTQIYLRLTISVGPTTCNGNLIISTSNSIVRACVMYDDDTNNIADLIRVKPCTGQTDLATRTLEIYCKPGNYAKISYDLQITTPYDSTIYQGDQWVNDYPVDATLVPTNLLKSLLDAKQALLVSGTNIKTIGGESILGSGNIPVGSITTTSLSGGELKDVLITNNGSWSTLQNVTITSGANTLTISYGVFNSLAETTLNGIIHGIISVNGTYVDNIYVEFSAGSETCNFYYVNNGSLTQILSVADDTNVTGTIITCYVN